MSDKTDEDEITRIEDLPDLEDLKTDEDDFVSLEDMAKDMDLSDFDEVKAIDEITNEFELNDQVDTNEYPVEQDSTALEIEQEEPFQQDENFDSDDFDQQDFSHTENNDTLVEFDSNEDSSTEDDFLDQEQFIDHSASENHSHPEQDGQLNSDFELNEEEANTEDKIDNQLDHESASREDEFDASFDEAPLDQDHDVNNDNPLEDIEKLDTEQVAPMSNNHKENSEYTPNDQTPLTRGQTEIYEIKQFGEENTYSGINVEGNPPFSIIIKNPKYKEDVDSITNILCELKIFNDSDKEQINEKLSSGQLLIPRLSEFVAIYICHKIRMYDVEILMGLTEEIQPPKSYTSNDRGLLTKYSVLNNKSYHYNFTSSSEHEIITTTLSSVSGHEIEKYLGIISATKEIGLNDISNANLDLEIFGEQGNKKLVEHQNLLASDSQQVELSNDYPQNSTPVSKPSFDDIYTELVNELKKQAINKKAHAIIGINLSIVALPKSNETDLLYKIQCTGNMVWLKKN